MADILGVSHLTDAGTAAAPIAKAAPPAPAAANGKTEISRSDLILLVQKLQKRSAAAEQQVQILKKQLAEKEASSSSSSSSSPPVDSTNLVDLLTSPTPTPAPAIDADTQTQLAKQAATHSAQIANLQADLKSKSDSIVELTRSIDLWKRRTLAAEDAQKKLTAAAAASAAGGATNPSSSASPSPTPVSSSPPAGGSSFLLENVNKELRAALATEQSKFQQSERRCTNLQARLEKMEQELNQASKSASETLTRRINELESKLNTSDSKLMKSFQLVTDEKKKVTMLQEESSTLKTKLSTLTEALSSSSDLLKESQSQVLLERTIVEQLRSDNFQLQTRLEMTRTNEDGDLRDLRKTLLSKDESLTSLQNELDHLRHVHARSLVSLEEDLTRQQRESENELERVRYELERLTTEYAHERHTLEATRKEDLERLKHLEQHVSNLERHLREAEDAKISSEMKLQELQQQYDTLVTKHDTAMSTHASSLETLQTNGQEKYLRLLHELKSFKIHVIQERTSLENELHTAREHIRTLEYDIRHGQPEERRLWELASLQSSRNESLREFELEVSELRSENIALKGRYEQVRSEKEFLTKELGKMRQATSRTMVNMEYLKSIIVTFITSEQQPTKRAQLIPVLSQLLQFTPDDIALINSSIASSSSGSSLWGVFSNLTGGGGGSGGATSHSKKIHLPPSIPMGIEIDHLPSPFANTRGTEADTTVTPPTAPAPAPSSSAQHQPMGSVDLTGAVSIAQP